MALNKDTLGVALYNAAQEFQNKTPEEVGDIEAFRLEFFKMLADEVIKHFIAAAVVSVSVTVTTTGNSTNQAGGGNGTGTIS